MEKHRDIQTVQVLIESNWELGYAYFDLDLRWQITLAEWAALAYLGTKPTWFTKWLRYKKTTPEERGKAGCFVLLLLFFGMLRIWEKANTAGDQENSGLKRKRENMTCICGESDEVTAVLYEALRLGASGQGVRRCKYGIPPWIAPYDQEALQKVYADASTQTESPTPFHHKAQWKFESLAQFDSAHYFPGIASEIQHVCRGIFQRNVINGKVL
jgi:hypothetical protein